MKFNFSKEWCEEMAEKETNQNVVAGSDCNSLFLHCSCHDLPHTLRFSFWHDDQETYTVETITPTTNIFKRIWQAVLWVLGFNITLNETVLTRKDAINLRNHLNKFLWDSSFVSEKARPMYDWLLKYDPKLKGNAQAIIQTLIENGAAAMYKESLSQAQPLDPEIAAALNKAGTEALKTYVGGLEDGDDEETIF